MSAPPMSAPPNSNNNPSAVNKTAGNKSASSSVTSTVIRVANEAVNGNSNANELARLLENPKVIKAAEELTKKLRSVGGSRRTRKSNKRKH